MKFVIVSLRPGCGGAIVLHTLCNYLTQLGYDASIYYVGQTCYKKGRKLYFWFKQIGFTIKDRLKELCVNILGDNFFSKKISFNGYVNVCVKKCKKKEIPIADKNTIVVYPDMIYGNFLHARKVVRWLLYYNRYDESAYGKDDLFLTYRDVFNDMKLNPMKRKLYTPYFNLDLYRQKNYGKRSGKCYVVRKGAKRLDLPEKLDGIVVDDLPEKEKVEIFNQCEYCISYDTQTAYSSIAAICGCISVVIPEVGKTWEDYCDSIEEKYGVAYSFDNDEIEWARRTANKARERYVMINQEGKQSAEEFVNYCKKYFGEQ